MGYIDENLLDGEQIVHQARTHKIIFFWPCTWLVLGAGCFAVSPDLAPIFLLLGVLHGIYAFINYLSSEFGLTNQRVIVKEGLIQRNTTELFLKKIESIQVDQSVMGRMLDYGTLTITGTGGQTDPIEGIPDPLEFKRQVQQQLRDL